MSLILTYRWYFPGATVDKNPPANAGDMDLIPGLRRSRCHGAAQPVDHNY